MTELRSGESYRGDISKTANITRMSRKRPRDASPARQLQQPVKCFYSHHTVGTESLEAKSSKEIKEGIPRARKQQKQSVGSSPGRRSARTNSGVQPPDANVDTESSMSPSCGSISSRCGSHESHVCDENMLRAEATLSAEGGPGLGLAPLNVVRHGSGRASTPTTVSTASATPPGVAETLVALSSGGGVLGGGPGYNPLHSPTVDDTPPQAIEGDARLAHPFTDPVPSWFQPMLPRTFSAASYAFPMSAASVNSNDLPAAALSILSTLSPFPGDWGTTGVSQAASVPDRLYPGFPHPSVSFPGMSIPVMMSGMSPLLPQPVFPGYPLAIPFHLMSGFRNSVPHPLSGAAAVEEHVQAEVAAES